MSAQDYTDRLDMYIKIYNDLAIEDDDEFKSGIAYGLDVAKELFIEYLAGGRNE